jgi:hypothetical protein
MQQTGQIAIHMSYVRYNVLLNGQKVVRQYQGLWSTLKILQHDCNSASRRGNFPAGKKRLRISGLTPRFFHDRC